MSVVIPGTTLKRQPRYIIPLYHQGYTDRLLLRPTQKDDVKETTQYNDLALQIVYPPKGLRHERRYTGNDAQETTPIYFRGSLAFFDESKMSKTIDSMLAIIKLVLRPEAIKLERSVIISFLLMMPFLWIPKPDRTGNPAVRQSSHGPRSWSMDPCLWYHLISILKTKI